MTPLARPLTYIVAILSGLLIVLSVQFEILSTYFFENLAINSMILGVFLFGIVLAFQRLSSLAYEMRWLNEIRHLGHASDREAFAGVAELKKVHMLAAFANAWRGLVNSHQTLTPDLAATLVDSAQNRLDEGRELSRYLITALVILGLLGTFWGLLGALLSMRESLGNLSVGQDFFAGLSGSLAGPLENMGTAFSSSLFGLAASLIFGFIELQTSKAHANFLEDFENWLATLLHTESSAKAWDGSHHASFPTTATNAEIMLDAERLRHLIRRGQQDTMVLNNNLVSLLDQIGRLLNRTTTDQDLQKKVLDAQATQEALITQLGQLVTTIQSAMQYPENRSDLEPDGSLGFDANRGQAAMQDRAEAQNISSETKL